MHTGCKRAMTVLTVAIIVCELSFHITSCQVCCGVEFTLIALEQVTARKTLKHYSPIANLTKCSITWCWKNISLKFFSTLTMVPFYSLFKYHNCPCTFPTAYRWLWIWWHICGYVIWSRLPHDWKLLFNSVKMSECISLDAALINTRWMLCCMKYRTCSCRACCKIKTEKSLGKFARIWWVNLSVLWPIIRSFYHLYHSLKTCCITHWLSLME